MGRHAGRESGKEILLSVINVLINLQIAHVIVLSDNRENIKRLAKAMPSKPLNSIALSDADSASSLSFVKQKLHDSGIDIGISGQQAQSVERLGGRASDLESVSPLPYLSNPITYTPAAHSQGAKWNEGRRGSGRYYQPGRC